MAELVEKTLVKKSVSISENAFIASGSAVVKNVPPHALITGVSGKIIGWVNNKRYKNSI